MHAGIYIHIPFCRSRCSYCDFATGAYDAARAERYVRAVVKEIEDFNRPNTQSQVDTIYFGGGTPSLLSVRQVALLLDAVQRKFNVSRDTEVTMEMNPGTVTPESLRELRRLGVNRASFGVQTFDDKELRRLGRVHTAEDARRTLRQLRDAGFTNISFDLIAGLPEQTLAGWERNLDEALSLQPEHLSLYLLEVHEGTPLAAQLARGMWASPDDDLAAEMYRQLIYRTACAGYEHYEISNFCLPGYQSRHNTKYWLRAPVYGFGCAAHSYDGGELRWSNTRDVLAYTELIEQGKDTVVENVTLDEHERKAEAVFLKLRLLEGINLEEHRIEFGEDLRHEYASELARLSEAGLVELRDDVLRLTSSGALLSNEVLSLFC